MKPIELTLTGFTSFREKTRIDFSKLDIFSITGPTGAGKSSILDAITYAIYGKVSRLQGLREQSAKQLCSQGRNSLTVQLLFQARGETYRITRSWKKKGKSGAENVYQAERRNGEIWELLSKDKEEASSLIGMTFETFTRVVLLPQGKFSDFLHSSSGDRQEIIKSLIPDFALLELMQAKARDKSNALYRALSQLDGRADSLYVPPKEEIIQRQNLEQELKSKFVQIQSDYKEIQNDYFSKQKLLQNLERLEVLRTEYNELSSNQIKIELIRGKIRNLEAAKRILNRYLALEEIRIYRREKFIEHERNAQNIQKLRQSLNELKITLGDAKERDIKIKRNEEIFRRTDAIKITLDQCHAEFHKATETKNKRESDFNSVRQELLNNQSLVAKIEDESNGLKKRIKSLGFDSERLSMFKYSMSSLKRFKEVSQKITMLESEHTNSELEIEETLAKISCKKQERERVLASRNEIDRNIHDLRQRDSVAYLRSQLYPGEVCPVCTGIYSGGESLDRVTEEAIHSLEIELKRVNQEIISYDEVLSELKANLASFRERQAYQAKQIEERQCERVDLSNTISTNFGNGWDIASLRKEYKDLQEKENDYSKYSLNFEKASKRLSEIGIKIAVLENKTNSTEREFEESKKEYHNRQATFAEVFNEFKTVLEPLMKHYELSEYEALGEKLSQDRDILDSQIQKLSRESEEIQDELYRAESDHESTLKDLCRIDLDIKNNEENWEVALAKEGLSTDTFHESRDGIDQIEDWKKEVADHEKEHIRLQTLIHDLEQQVGNESFTAHDLKVIEEKLSENSIQEKELQERLIEIRNWFRRVELDISEYEKISNEKEKIGNENFSYSSIAKMLEKGKFSKYILNCLELEIVERATDLLQQLSGRYSLVSQKDTFFVRDNWNADETRNIRTLSGGETFLAALSMGLALSEKLAGEAEVGSLWIDEGFGALDEESLVVVREALERLPSQNRIVGIVTHLQDLADQLPAQIKVLKSSTGSSVEVVY
ncbi:AAA family ATPase [Nodosilinea sp. PGN35]|uniref:AAA family ATPase n=1 Tax=Nodosilinea sp. PGN35 TaxID=3020489 RepID=UPI0023B2A730|nr:SMC family ATPase [Nodosilinea sp. TSF1-S3]MDF0367042.1 SMC family ATPase [Nodosilinea sp. TSF1-S3]